MNRFALLYPFGDETSTAPKRYEFLFLNEGGVEFLLISWLLPTEWREQTYPKKRDQAEHSPKSAIEKRWRESKIRQPLHSTFQGWNCEFHVGFQKPKLATVAPKLRNCNWNGADNQARYRTSAWTPMSHVQVFRTR